MIAVALLALQMVRCRCSRVRTIADDYMPHSFEGRPHIALAPVMLGDTPQWASAHRIRNSAGPEIQSRRRQRS